MRASYKTTLLLTTLISSGLIALSACSDAVQHDARNSSPVDTAISESTIAERIAFWWYSLFPDHSAPQEALKNLSALRGTSFSEMEAYPFQTISGNYLSARFAQNNFDWLAADSYMNNILATDPDNMDLLRRSMVLSMGSGNYTAALEMARKLVTLKDDASLTHILVVLDKYKQKNYQDLLKDIQAIPNDGISDFIKPLILSWAKAGIGKTDISNLNKNTVQVYHAILISDYLNDKAALQSISQQDLSPLSLSVKSLEKIADIFARHKLNDAAKKLYLQIKAENPQEETTDKKIQHLNDPSSHKPDVLAKPINDPQDGLAQALFDMATVLHQDFPDSARVFTHMALFIDPNINDAHILLAYLASEHSRHDEAIAHYQGINTENNPELAIKVQRQIADLLEESGRTDQAIRLLNKLVQEKNAIDAQIQIGDIYRQQEQFDKALNAYNTAFTMLGDKDSKAYWDLFYARGIAHERVKNWAQAEEDLLTALRLQPNHPYILNYLAYSWADQSKNLDRALEMINRAVRLRPNDGYIIDSLGWVYYKMGRFQNAVDVLERAIEMMPHDTTVNDHLGDAYWQVERYTEARFQWRRALSLTSDPKEMAALEQKIADGVADARHPALLPSTDSTNADTTATATHKRKAATIE